MSVNRFSKPAQQQYISQFVPEDLAAMRNSINLSQKAHDETEVAMEGYQDDILKVQSFGASDTASLKAKREEFDNYISSLSGKDLGNKKVSREVAKYIKDFKAEGSLGQIQGSYDHNVQAEKNWNDLIKKGEDNPANYAKYLASQDQYRKTGYKGNALAGNTFNPNVDTRPEIEKMVNNMKANGWGRDTVSGEWINGNTGQSLTEDRLMETMEASLPGFMNSAAGRQMQNNADYRGVGLMDMFNNEASSVAREYAHRTQKSTLKAISNYDREGAENLGSPALLNQRGVTTRLNKYNNTSEAKGAVAAYNDPNSSSYNPLKGGALQSQLNYKKDKYMAKNLSPNEKKILVVIKA